MEQQALKDEWARLLIEWKLLYEQAHIAQTHRHDKMTNHLAYNRAPPTAEELEILAELWSREAIAKNTLEEFINKHSSAVA
jgi:hypothetical protein